MASQGTLELEVGIKKSKMIKDLPKISEDIKLIRDLIPKRNRKEAFTIFKRIEKKFRSWIDVVETQNKPKRKKK